MMFVKIRFFRRSYQNMLILVNVVIAIERIRDWRACLFVVLLRDHECLGRVGHLQRIGSAAGSPDFHRPEAGG